MYDTITLTHREGVSTITINRPPLNTVTPHALVELVAAFDALEARPETRAVVLTGSGTRAFCAGANLDDKPRSGQAGDQSAAAETGDVFRERGRLLIERIEGFPKPVVAAIRGWAIGGGFAIAQACDVRIAAEDARFRTGDAYIGIVPSWGISMVRLVHYIGRNRTLDLLMLGEDIGAQKAQELGLVTRVVPVAELDAEVARIADRLASGAPLVFRAIKEAVLSQYYEGPAAARHLETHWSEATKSSADYREGIAAFKEKRKPAFKGQ